jgi:hypothetical protein
MQGLKQLHVGCVPGSRPGRVQAAIGQHSSPPGSFDSKGAQRTHRWPAAQPHEAGPALGTRMADSMLASPLLPASVEPLAPAWAEGGIVPASPLASCVAIASWRYEESVSAASASSWCFASASAAHAPTRQSPHGNAVAPAARTAWARAGRTSRIMARALPDGSHPGPLGSSRHLWANTRSWRSPRETLCMCCEPLAPACRCPCAHSTACPGMCLCRS